MPYRILSHTADTGIEIWAPTFSALIQEAAEGMFGLMANIGSLEENDVLDETIDAVSTEDLLVDVLSELLYRSEVEGRLLGGFEVSILDRLTARVRARGVDVDSVEVTGPPIKAVTYHDLNIEEGPGSWHARVYFDV